MSARNCGPVPSRWLRCPRKASNLIINKFMAFKTPLNHNFDDKVAPEYRFPPKMLFDLCKTKKIKFGLWIDLTNTSRFYDKEEVREQDCKYFKMSCRGHGETPSEEATNKFITIVHDFIAQHPLEAIAVHCTHGFNRTGFLIVSYLVEKLDCGLEVALEMFAKVRPPGIYKEDYLKELYRRYDDIEDAPPAPDLPDWCFDEEEQDDNIEGETVKVENHFVQDVASTSGTSEKPQRRGRKQVEFMKGVNGVYHYNVQPKASQLQKEVQVMCEWKSKGFPGSQPVSMDMENIKMLHLKPYRVSWKADGMRYMMLIDGPDDIYFFDRDNNVFKVEGLKFPYRKNLRQHLTNTLLDGEMVIDKVNGQDIPRYLAYDIIKFQGQDVGKMPFHPTRMLCIENEIIKPRHMAMEQGLIDKMKEPFSVRKKEFWDVTQATNLLGEKFAKTLSHEPDGLIFQPAKDSYAAGPCDDVLKWKPIELNSIDFRLEIVQQQGMGLVSCKVANLYVGQLDRPFGTMRYTKAIKDLNKKIVECKWENNEWKFMRERTDKSYPNSYNTAKAVIESIRNPVTKEYLIDFIRHNRFEDDSERMPPPAKKPR